MGLAGRMTHGGKGIMATAGGDGNVNAAVYALPQIMEDRTVAWGMTEGRTYRNVMENPFASYLYIEPGDGYRGVRLTLRLKEIRDSGKVLGLIRARTKESAGQGAADAVRYVAFFEIVEERPLV